MSAIHHRRLDALGVAEPAVTCVEAGNAVRAAIISATQVRITDEIVREYFSASGKRYQNFTSGSQWCRAVMKDVFAAAGFEVIE